MAKFKAILLRRWPILVVTLVLGAVAGFASTLVGAERGVTVYTAQQVIIANRLSGNPANVQQDALKVNRGAVPERAAELLEEEERADRLGRRVNQRPDKDSNSITLTVNDPDPERASELVQAFSTAFLEVVNDELRSEDRRQGDQLVERVEQATAALEAFDLENGFVARGDLQLPQTPTLDALVAERNRLLQTLSAAQSQLDSFELQTRETAPYSTLGVERPRVADAQLIEVPESPLFRAGLLGLIGMLLGVALVLVIERVNQRIDTRDELAALITVPIVAEIGKIPARRRPTAESGRLELDGVWSEHYRRVRSAIQFVQADAHAKAERGEGLGLNGSATGSGAVIAGHRSISGEVPRVFLFASALPGEGKSTSVALTAMALAETGTDTLVVNADFRRPMVETYLNTGHSPSLADRAELNVDRASIDDVVLPTEVDHLWMAAGGPPTTEVGGRLEAAKEVAAAAAAQGGTVLLDSSPLRVSNDPIDLLAAVDEVILVVRAGRTTVKSLQDTMELLEMHHAPVLGVVLIGTLATREMYAYYQSYYRRLEEAGTARKGDGEGGFGATNGAVPDGPAPDGEPAAAEEQREDEERESEQAPPPYSGALTRNLRPDLSG